ncbi:MAG: flagellar protein export ATPase FliI [Candidatus Handelsmanbacteria bacterium RIFCSPLOWO2_12_FULL_64_10]|uniref:Flagellar protein export ATPase FliI n=1 Tax=Handelsmanbacteria sp. (strain RIFCSPLOWO2_12_FULL_64_10) TaxID=1817868 RepID=A0A1F6D5V8_HANXR|nr:MAG: flagellar protein export ATPase FliI [Candidatus Handelsmanbacteria bacterium RIFCSPLOWO2_12_FULL_64_10]
MNYESLLETTRTADAIRLRGKVNQMVGLVIESNGPPVSVGELCEIRSTGSATGVDAEVVGFRDNKVLLMPLGPVDGVGPGSTVSPGNEPFSVRVGEELLGRVLNGLGRPIDDKGPVWSKEKRPINGLPPDPLRRQRIREPLGTGIRAIDALVTCGRGQRVGIFSGSGVGKSVLMGMIARNSEADINVIALIGERGREVRDFLERDLGEEGLRRSVVVVVTSDQPALVRIKGALVATAIAEHFRDGGANVMLMMDSVTRVAMAQREVGLAIGEPPTTRGYTPSVFAFLPRLLERAGMAERGSITGLYTVLVEGDDTNEPVSDTTRSILDGHIVLSRRLASQGHYPAVDVLESVSRVMVDVVDEEHTAASNQIRDILATYREAQDLINIGAYRRGNNPRIDFAIERIDRINAFLRQGIQERADLQGAREMMMKLLE